MASCNSSYELHHHFPKIAEESGFTFNTHRPRIRLDWNKIKLLDIDSLTKERKFVLLEKHINDILDCVLESEFDVRILDEGVVKMFRLAQLTVEYQQFCRHYMDRSVFVLREEITSIAQELDATKKDLREKEEEIRKLRKRSRYTLRNSLPYGNENIANMILKTLSNKGDLFQALSDGDSHQYNKCTYCDKVFLNQLYLRSHISRRHTANASEIPQRDLGEDFHINDTKNNSREDLSNEIVNLKSKLKEIEELIINANKQKLNAESIKEKNTDATEIKVNNAEQTMMKDAEVSTNNDAYIMDKLDEWKKEEHDRQNQEMAVLKSQIMEMMNTFKNKEAQKTTLNETDSAAEDLNHTIQQQGSEITALRKELVNSRITLENEDKERRKEVEAKIAFWEKRAEAQSQQYELIVQKLNDVTTEARQFRALAESEKQKAAQLQVLLQQTLNKSPENIIKVNSIMEQKGGESSKPYVKTQTLVRSEQIQPKTASRNSLEQLHRKAQELLDMGSSSSSDVTNTSEENKLKEFNKERTEISPKIIITKKRPHKQKAIKKSNQKHSSQKEYNEDIHSNSENKHRKVKKEMNKSNKIKLVENGHISPGSPLKLIRAKITEEVSNRLVSAGVDPLKSRLAHGTFQRQRIMLQQQNDIKSKKTPARDKARHTILAYLDSSILDNKVNDRMYQVDDYASPNKISKTQKITSMISTVKNKALSLVKNSEHRKERRDILNSTVANRAIALLKTPPGSSSPSPLKQRSTASNDTTAHNNTRTKRNLQMNTVEMVKKIETKSNAVDYHLDKDESSESDHKYCTYMRQSSAIDLIKSPSRRPSSAMDNTTGTHNYDKDENEHKLVRSQSTSNIISEMKSEEKFVKKMMTVRDIQSSDENSIESLLDSPIKKTNLKEGIKTNPKGVLKNASSISSLSKKKVLFDMDAIQMKSVSASPSQSLTEKSNDHEKYELGLINLDGEEWDISSIDNEPLKNDTKIPTNFRTSPKIQELKETIESQLAKRNNTSTPSTVLVGGVDMLTGNLAASRAASTGGSNTSLGSSILDDSESVTGLSHHKTLVKPKRVTEKEDSEIEISEFSLGGIDNKNQHESF